MRTRSVETIEGVEDAGAGTTEKAVALDQQGSRTVASSGDGGGGTGRAGADHDYVIDRCKVRASPPRKLGMSEIDSFNHFIFRLYYARNLNYR